MSQEVISSDRLVQEVDSEVKEVADFFRFILKYRQQFQPSGVEFSDLRKYLPSDDASRIDWKSSARTNELYVKEYELERDTDTFIILDTSETMTFGTAEKLKSEYAAVMAATLAYASVDMGTKVGIGMYGDQKLFLPPERGMTQYHKILRQVTNHENYGGSFNLSNALEDAVGRLKPSTSIFIISDFLRDESDWSSEVELCDSKFRHMLSIMLRDLRDYELPEAGNVRFESPSGDSSFVANTSRIGEEFREEAEKQEKEVKESLRSSGSEVLKIDTRDSFAAEMARFFDKGREW
jgi:uncharacterized protein (DUF58 family)